MGSKCERRPTKHIAAAEAELEHHDDGGHDYSCAPHLLLVLHAFERLKVQGRAPAEAAAEAHVLTDERERFEYTSFERTKNAAIPETRTKEIRFEEGRPVAPAQDRAAAESQPAERVARVDAAELNGSERGIGDSS